MIINLEKIVKSSGKQLKKQFIYEPSLVYAHFVCVYVCVLRVNVLTSEY